MTYMTPAAGDDTSRGGGPSRFAVARPSSAAGGARRRRRAVPLRGSRPRFGRLDVTVARRRSRHQRIDEVASRLGDLLHGAVECRLVRLGGPVEPAQLAHELKRGGADLVLGGGGREI